MYSRSGSGRRRKGESAGMSQFTTILGVFGGCAAVFYAVGFTTVQSYVYKYPLDGMIWFTSEFYRDAGAKFLLEFVRTPLVAWYVFFPYLIALYQLVPRGDRLRLARTGNDPVLAAHWVGVTALGAMLVLTYAVALQFDAVLGSRFGADAIALMFARVGNGDVMVTASSLAFFTLTAPVVIVGAAFLWRYRGCVTLNGDANRRTYGLVAAAYLVYLAILPISYGFHLYDWRIVPVQNPTSSDSGLRVAENAPASFQAWLLGEFGGKYVFLAKAGPFAPGVLEAVAVSDVKHLLLEPSRSVSLKEHLVRHTDSKALGIALKDFSDELRAIPGKPK
jgi:hypothetical protein